MYSLESMHPPINALKPGKRVNLRRTKRAYSLLARKARQIRCGSFDVRPHDRHAQAFVHASRNPDHRTSEEASAGFADFADFANPRQRAESPNFAFPLQQSRTSGAKATAPLSSLS